MYLNAHSYYSFRYGTFSVEQLLELAQKKGHESIAITDINNTCGALSFVRLATKYGIKPIVGVDFRNGVDQLFVAIAINNAGFFEINQYLSKYLHSKKTIPLKAPRWNNVFVIYPFNKVGNPKTLLPNEYIGIPPEVIPKFWKTSKLFDHEKTIAFPTATFNELTDYNKHRLLRAIDNNTLLSKLPQVEPPTPNDYFLDANTLKKRYENHPQLLERANLIGQQVHIDFAFEQYKHQNQETYTHSKKHDTYLLRRLCLKGLKKRYTTSTKTITNRILQELDIIIKKGAVSYFLINWDITSYARSKGYFYVGRGSGANSIVAYLLFITDVDPLKLDLYFERFMNLYRRNPPDFDIDFSWQDRGDITNYIFQRFPHVTLLGAYVTFQYRAAVREVGKVLGLPPHEIDVLTKRAVSLETLDKMQFATVKYAQLISGLPNHLSIHAAGILITRCSINHFSATSLPPKGYPTSHFDMLIAEDIGIFKFDILGQRGLGKIKDTLAIVKKNQPTASMKDIHELNEFIEDPKVKELLREARAIGCFYVESPAMRMLLQKLKADDYLGLVAASSIIRPGVAKSGMMREYILRHRDPKKRLNAHPALLEIMPETYGVMVYQEDVIKVAHHFAGLTLDESDVLRRGMSGKYRSREEFAQVKQRFFNNCRQREHTLKDTEDIWMQIESFAGYAFAKGHSASYAVESFQSLYLKAYFPLEYLVAILNNGGGFYSKELYLHEARMHGAQVVPPCINKSDWLHLIEGNVIYLGFSLINEIEQQTVFNFLDNRKQNGSFDSFEDFLDRTPISLEQISLLIRINAFQFTNIPRKSLLWRAHWRLQRKPNQTHTAPIFTQKIKKHQLPTLDEHQLEEAFEQIDLLGFSLINPFRLLRTPLQRPIGTKHLPHFVNKTIITYGYLITIKNTATNKGQRMHFGTFLDFYGNFLDTVHFPNPNKKSGFMGAGIYKLRGKVVEEFDFYSIEVEGMEKVLFIEDPRYTNNEDSKRIA